MSDAGALYSVAQVRAFDANAITVLGVPGYTLMNRAAVAALGVLRERWPQLRRVAIATGGGNNGGDGLVLARLARASGLEVTVLALVAADTLRGDARRAADELVRAGGELLAFDGARLAGAELLVDALLGTGLHEPVQPVYRDAIEALNRSGRPILALDLPSGLDGDSGAVLGAGVRASCTITFVAQKTGLFLREGPEYAGAVLLDDLQVAPLAGEAGRPTIELASDADMARALPPRPRSAHKGDFGRVLIVGGGPGMPGAVRLAGDACLRSGAGLVTSASAPENLSAIVSGRPELICIAARSSADIREQLAAATVVAVGPGLGTGEWSRELFAAVLGCGKPLVIDADGLNLLALSGLRPPAAAILTPHPGEAARLLGVTSAAVQVDRLAALNRLVAITGAVVVLKGAGTLVGAPGKTPKLCVHGNPGMAGPGMGDVLTGAIAGILAQCADPWLAACAGVQAHARAGDELARVEGARGLLALDLAAGLPRWLNASLRPSEMQT